MKSAAFQAGNRECYVRDADADLGRRERTHLRAGAENGVPLTA